MAEGLARRVSSVSAQQKGLITTDQLRACGLSDAAIHRWVAAGRLRRLHRGVFSPSPVLAPLAKELAAVLACGPGAAVWGRSAAGIWRLLPLPEIVEIAVPKQSHRSRPGIRIHRPTTPPKTTVRHGIPLTTPDQTLHDLATTEDKRTLDRAINEAMAARLTTREKLLSLAASSTHPTARANLRTALHTNTGFTRSEAERRLKRIVKKGGLPPPETNAEIGDYECDAVWREQRVVVEFDGFATHNTRERFERDRAKSAQLTAAGWRVIRLTWRQLTNELETAVLLARVLYAP